MVRPEDFDARIGDNGLIGGESFMAGDWAASDLAAVLEVIASSAGTPIPVPLQKLRSMSLPRAPRQGRNTEQNTRPGWATTTRLRCGSGRSGSWSAPAKCGSSGFDEVFQRMWLFYLCDSRAGFQSGCLDVQRTVLDCREAQL